MKDSSRWYKISVCDKDGVTIEKAPLQSISENNEHCELYNAINDQIDKVLDLKEGESMYIQPNRDNKESKGIIYRAK